MHIFDRSRLNQRDNFEYIYYFKYHKLIHLGIYNFSDLSLEML